MAAQPETVEDGKVVSMHYRLTDDEGELLDSSAGGDPMAYLHGAGNIVSGLERQLDGHKVGDSVSAVVSPEDGYGMPEGPGPRPVSRSDLPDGMQVQAGMPLVAEDPDGNLMPIWITKVETDKVYVDTNHPLAGQTLYFEVEITDVRDATKEELQHGHVHGPGGHHH